MAKVTLKNRTRRPPRMLTLNLARKVAAKKVVRHTYDEDKDGNRHLRQSTILAPDSIRIPAGSTVKVDEKALGSPEVAKAIRKRKIEVIRDEEPKNDSGPAPKTGTKTEPKEEASSDAVADVAAKEKTTSSSTKGGSSRRTGKGEG